MKELRGICLGLFFGMPYGILAIIITRYINQDDFFYWLTIIMLVGGIICLLLSTILPSRKDKSE